VDASGKWLEQESELGKQSETSDSLSDDVPLSDVAVVQYRWRLWVELLDADLRERVFGCFPPICGFFGWRAEVVEHAPTVLSSLTAVEMVDKLRESGGADGAFSSDWKRFASVIGWKGEESRFLTVFREERADVVLLIRCKTDLRGWAVVHKSPCNEMGEGELWGKPVDVDVSFLVVVEVLLSRKHVDDATGVRSGAEAIGGASERHDNDVTAVAGDELAHVD